MCAGVLFVRCVKMYKRLGVGGVFWWELLACMCGWGQVEKELHIRPPLIVSIAKYG